jgi:hypothetical protein
MLTKYPSLEGLASTFGVPRLQAVFGGLFSRLQALGTALTNSSTETILASKTIPADTLRIGMAVDVEGMVEVTAAQSTDTLTLKAYLGSTEIFAMSAVDVAANDLSSFRVKLVSLTAPGATVDVYAIGDYSIFGSTSTVAVKAKKTSIATNGDLVLSIKGTWSVASNNNSARAVNFDVTVTRGDA